MYKHNLKIYMISGDYPPCKGGLADYTKCLIDELEEKSAKNKIFLITTTLKQDIISKKNKNILEEVKQWNLLGMIKTIRILKKHKPDIIHIQYPTAQYKKNIAINFLPLFLKLFTSVPVILTLHEFSNKSIFGKLRIMPMILFSDKITIVSEEYKSAILKLSGCFKKYLQKKMIYIPIGPNIFLKKDITKNDIRETRESMGAKNEDIILCFFGAIRINKGVIFLLESFKHLVNNGCKNIKLLFIGRNDDILFAEMKSFIKKNKLEKIVSFTGFCTEEKISKYLMASDICAIPLKNGLTTKRGSFFAPLFHKLPIITTYSNFMPEGLVNYKNVVLIKYGDKNGFQRAILELAENKNLRDKLSKNIPELLEHFSWDTIANQTINLYDDCHKK